MARELPWHHKSLVRLVVALVVGVVVGAGFALFGRAEACFVAGWATAALVFTAWVWFSVRHLDAERTREMVRIDDPGRRISRVVVLFATFASMVGVGILLASGEQHGAGRIVDLVTGVAAIVCSWTLVHMLFMLRYAELYYGEGDEGITFPGNDKPDFQDFAYFSYCLGMTYQTSDCSIETRPIRREVNRHTLLSYVLGAVVVASTVNLVVQIASGG